MSESKDTPEQIHTDRENAFGMLSTYGVSRERAKSVTTGIMVLMTRMDREHHALEASIGVLRQRLADMTKSRDEYHALNQKNLATATGAVGLFDQRPGQAGSGGGM